MSSLASPDRDGPAIGSHRLLGDGRSAALLTPSGEIDWWCAPRFDSPPVFWSLLDPGGAAARFDGAEPHECAGEPAGAATHTKVRVGTTVVDIHDGLVDGRVLRVVRGVDGDLDVTHRCRMGGFVCETQAEEHLHRLQAQRGTAVALAIGPDGVELADPDQTTAKLLAAQSAFRRGNEVARNQLHRDRILDAFAVVRACTYEPTGTVVAAVTTSLPEKPGGDRQFDYRYAWLRDGSLAASVAALHGRLDIARDHLRFVAGLGKRVLEAPLFTVDGGPVPAEEHVEGVAGWARSRPVRTGNQAARQVQFDALGFVVEAVSTFTREGGRLTRDLWRTTRVIADRCVDGSPGSTSGIWEFRGPGAFVSADIGRWVALERAIRVAKRRRPWTRCRRWTTTRDELRDRILDELLDDGRLPQLFGGDPDQLDASALLIVMFGLLDTEDPRAAALVDRHLKELSDGVHVRRYSADVDDGFDQPEATFVVCSWWAVTALAAVGRIDEATERSGELCASLPRLLAEEFDPPSATALGNVPLVWAHAEAARALRVLEVAQLRRRSGTAGVVVDSLLRRTRRLLGRR